MAALLSGCILFPPFWGVPGFEGGGEIVIENATDADWVVEMAGDVPIAFAVGADQVGTMTIYGFAPDELILRDPECEEVDRLPWDGSSAAVRIEEPGALTTLDEAPSDDAEFLVEFWDCLGTSLPPEPGDPLPEVGGKILVTSNDGAPFALDVSEGSVALIGPEPEGGSFSTDTEHAWSPDGSRLAFARVGGDGDGTYVANADGSVERLLVEAGGTPRWSPDGTAIAYIDINPFAGGAGLGVADAETGETRLLATDASAPAWSPDGERLAFFSFTGFTQDVPNAADLLVVDATGGDDPRTIATGAYPYATPPSWSPDGTRLAFIALPEGGAGGTLEQTILAVHDFTSGETTQLLMIPDGSVTDAAWSPDGASIAVTIETPRAFGSTGSIGLVDASTGELSQLQEWQNGSYRYPVWSPDGEWLLFTRTDADLTGSLIAMRRDGSEEHTLATSLLAAAQWVANPGD